MSHESQTNEKVADHPGYYILSPENIRKIQIGEADAHQQIVDSGKCWAFYPMPEQSDLPSSLLTPHGIQLEHSDPALVWDNVQKSTFIELIGRWTPSRLPEIAQHIGKPIFECQRYLEMLRNHPRCIDVAEIPAAEEVPAKYMEPSIPVEDFEPLGPDQLFWRQRVEARLGQKFNDGEFACLESMLTLKLKKWLAEFIRQYDTTGHIVKDQKTYIENIIMSESGEAEFMMNDELAGDDESDKEVCGDYGYDVAAPEDKFPDDVDISDDSDEGEALIEAETNWLESLDTFKSAQSLIFRGFQVESMAPPPERSHELEKFMRS